MAVICFFRTFLAFFGFFFFGEVLEVELCTDALVFVFALVDPSMSIIIMSLMCFASEPKMPLPDVLLSSFMHFAGFSSMFGTVFVIAWITEAVTDGGWESFDDPAPPIPGVLL